jgi:hypothetical protein
MDTAQRRLPEFVRAAVEQRMGTADIEFALASDLSPDGRFGESWLVLANETLLTLRVDHTPIETSTSARLPWLRKNGSQNGGLHANGAPYLNGSAPRVSIERSPRWQTSPKCARRSWSARPRWRRFCTMGACWS